MDTDNRDMENTFAAFREKMLEQRIDVRVIEEFKKNFENLIRGVSGKISRDMIDPVSTIPDYAGTSDFTKHGMDALPKTIVIKLNGGLGTSMGMEQAKSLIPVKNGLSFLDIITRQILRFREEYSCRLPLLLMNSGHTSADSLAVLAKYPEIQADLPLDFLQNRVPKVFVSDYSPALWPQNPELEWCPPGHGDIYTALRTSNLLQSFLKAGYEYMFISNADNLGAVMDVNILGYVAANGIDFLMEVTDRTAADKKGGHLAQLKDGSLTLREIAQCPDEELSEFQNIALHKYFNTNSLWIHLPSLAALLESHQGILPLPTIINRKTLDPKDADSPQIYQLETAMGAAITYFKRASALRVPRTRFAPVKTTDDLLTVWSDAYILTDRYQLVPNPDRTLPVLSVTLDKAYYRFIDQLHERFPSGAPSLIDCISLRITGNFIFGRNVKLTGEIELFHSDKQEHYIPDGSNLR